MNNLMMRGLEHHLEQLGCITLLTVLETQLDAGNASAFKAIVTKLQDSSPQLVLDLSQVQFLDSPGCGALLTALRCLDRLGGRIKVCCLTRSARHTLELCQMHRILEVYETRDEAIGAFGTGSALWTSPEEGAVSPYQPATAPCHS